MENTTKCTSCGHPLYTQTSTFMHQNIETSEAKPYCLDCAVANNFVTFIDGVDEHWLVENFFQEDYPKEQLQGIIDDACACIDKLEKQDETNTVAEAYARGFVQGCNSQPDEAMLKKVTTMLEMLYNLDISND